MSVNSYDNQTKTLTSVAGGTRVWIGTDSAHTSAVSGGTMPNNCMVYITDDTSDQISNTPTAGSNLPISSDGVYQYCKKSTSGTISISSTYGTGTNTYFRVGRLVNLYINSCNLNASIPVLTRISTNTVPAPASNVRFVMIQLNTMKTREFQIDSSGYLITGQTVSEGWEAGYWVGNITYITSNE